MQFAPAPPQVSYDWQFSLQNNRSRFTDEGIKFFPARATDEASALGYRLIMAKDVMLQHLPNNVWKIKGTVILEYSTERPPEVSIA